MSKSIYLTETFKFIDQEKNCCVFKFVYPSGFKHLDLTSISEFGDEAEYITYPGEQFIVTDIDSSDAIKQYTLKYVGNMYQSVQQISQKVDPKIDQMFPLFKQCVSQYLSLTPTECDESEIKDPTIFFPKAKQIISQCELQNDYFTGDITVSSVEMNGYNIDKILYSIYASAKFDPVYFIPDMKLIAAYTASSLHTIIGTTKIGQTVFGNDLISQYLKGNLKSIEGMFGSITPQITQILCFSDLSKQLGFS